jgi:hypothetical protein
MANKQIARELKQNYPCKRCSKARWKLRSELDRDNGLCRKCAGDDRRLYGFRQR